MVIFQPFLTPSQKSMGKLVGNPNLIVIDDTSSQLPIVNWDTGGKLQVQSQQKGKWLLPGGGGINGVHERYNMGQKNCVKVSLRSAMKIRQGG